MFLKQIAKYIAENESDDLGNKCFVFPNRRSGLFFKRFLIDHLDKPTWAPSIIAINELMEQLSEMSIADPLDLLFRVYDIYADVSPSPESFDQFYQWGELMIQDFDTIDKYLIDHKDIFRNIQELKEIEEGFGGLTPEQVSFIKRFWTNFQYGEESKEKQDFLTIWKILPSIYDRFTKGLSEDGIGYEGMLYRNIAGYDAVELLKKTKFTHYFFVGFNALSKAEIRLFRNMKRAGIASFFWDYDVVYEQDMSMEAGMFIRENLKKFPPPVDLKIFSNLSGKNNIKIFDLPTDILQAKAMNEILSEVEIDMEDPNHTAVVACDENLLMPILSSLPERLQDVNITMGYPFKNTPLSSFVESVLKLHSNNFSRNYTKGRFYHKDVLSILNHQYYQLIYSRNEQTGNSLRLIFESEDNDPLNPDKNTDIDNIQLVSKLIERFINENHVYISQDEFTDSFSQLVFRPVKDANDFCIYLEKILLSILQGLNDEDESVHVDMEREYLFLLRNRLNKLSDYFSDRQDIDIQTFVKFFNKLIAGLRIPFVGEPLSGLQIMGILETRLLDFKQVIMLSVNEEVIPGNQNKNSFIPYAFRYAFGLPTISEMDAIYAYYYYRLVQRSEHVNLLYNSSSEGVSTGEMSRYLYQMKYQFNATEEHITIPVNSIENHQINIKKDNVILQKLEESFTGIDDAGRFLSPSALNTYLDCGLKFYFRKVLGIGEKDTLLEEVDAIGFGNIVHESLDYLYQKMIGMGADEMAEYLSALLRGNQIDEVLEREFKAEYYKQNSNREIEGQNLIIIGILRRYITSVIKHDLSELPFEIIEMEKLHKSVVKIETPNGEKLVRLGGKIDRVDRKFGITRVIDYKTGQSKRKFESVESLFDTNNANRNKHAFQALLYAFFLQSENHIKDIQPGLYVIRELTGNYQPQLISSVAFADKLGLFDSVYELFLEQLKDLLTEIYDPKISFTQTEIVERCKYCEFREICQR